MANVLFCVWRSTTHMSPVPMQKFLLLRFLLRWMNVGVYTFLSVMMGQLSFYVHKEKLNLYLATALSASSLLVVCTAWSWLVNGMRRASKTHQQWCATIHVALYVQNICAAMLEENACDFHLSACRQTFCRQTCLRLLQLYALNES